MDMKDEDSVIAMDENGNELLSIKLSDIPKAVKGYSYWMDKEDPNLIRLEDGIGSAAAVSRNELLKNFEEFFDGDVVKPFKEKALWDYVMVENFTAWIDICAFEDFPAEDDEEEDGE